MPDQFNKKHFKNILLFIILCCLLCCLAACGTSDNITKDNDVIADQSSASATIADADQSAKNDTPQNTPDNNEKTPTSSHTDSSDITNIISSEEATKNDDEPANIQNKNDPNNVKKPATQDTLNTEATTADKQDESTCHLLVSCAVLLDKQDELDSAKLTLLPEDGIILSCDAVFSDGESVFDVLSRELKKNKIHFEFSSNPAFNSVYIEGINNLYQFDCGDLSGWVYFVNGEMPGYGCNQQILQDGDSIEWLFTCDMGRDVTAGGAE